MHYSTILTAGIAALGFSTSSLGLNIPVESSLEARAEPHANVTPFPFDEAHASALENAFEAIASIPDDVLDSGEDALKAWINTHEAVPEVSTRSASLEADLEPRQSLFHILACAGAIIKAIAENAFPISKLRRLRELIKALGGARKVAKLLLKAKSFHEILIIGGPELEHIAEILLGISDVAQACFSF